MARPEHLIPVECPYCGARFMDIRLFSINEVASRLGVALNTIKGWIRTGELESRVWVRGKVGPVRYVIDSYDVEEFMGRHFPKRSTLRPDHENVIARRAYRALRFKKPPGEKKNQS